MLATFATPEGPTVTKSVTSEGKRKTPYFTTTFLKRREREKGFVTVATVFPENTIHKAIGFSHSRSSSSYIVCARETVATVTTVTKNALSFQI